MTERIQAAMSALERNFIRPHLLQQNKDVVGLVAQLLQQGDTVSVGGIDDAV